MQRRRESQNETGDAGSRFQACEATPLAARLGDLDDDAVGNMVRHSVGRPIVDDALSSGLSLSLSQRIRRRKEREIRLLSRCIYFLAGRRRLLAATAYANPEMRP